MGFQEDHFSGHAGDYAAHRPTYPQELFEYLATIAPGTGVAWDCATGNGQAAVALADFFDRVVATDASLPQIEAAASHPRVHYRHVPAESVPFADASIDLVTVAQALHWFEVETFYGEAKRVLRPNGILAVWCYGFSIITPEIDALVRTFNMETVGPYWPDKRRHIDSGYTTLPLPFAPLDSPAFEMKLEWTLEQFLAYLRTWSSVKRYMAEQESDPVNELALSLGKMWGQRTRGVVWPLTLKAGCPQ